MIKCMIMEWWLVIRDPAFTIAATFIQRVLDGIDPNNERLPSTIK